MWNSTEQLRSSDLLYILIEVTPKYLMPENTVAAASVAPAQKPASLENKTEQ